MVACCRVRSHPSGARPRRFEIGIGSGYSDRCLATSSGMRVRTGANYVERVRLCSRTRSNSGASPCVPDAPRQGLPRGQGVGAGGELLRRPFASEDVASFSRSARWVLRIGLGSPYPSLHGKCRKEAKERCGHDNVCRFCQVAISKPTRAAMYVLAPWRPHLVALSLCRSFKEMTFRAP